MSSVIRATAPSSWSNLSLERVALFVRCVLGESLDPACCVVELIDEVVTLQTEFIDVSSHRLAPVDSIDHLADATLPVGDVVLQCRERLNALGLFGLALFGGLVFRLRRDLRSYRSVFLLLAQLGCDE
jgi:hypothetical protein